MRLKSRFSSFDSVFQGFIESPSGRMSLGSGLIGVSAVPFGRIPRSIIRGSTHSR